MLVQFTVSNFLSFKNPVTLSLVASPIKEFRDSNTFELREDLRLTKGAVIYGANASGKSNLLQAMRVMEIFVRHSVERLPEGAIPWARRFRLSDEAEGKPSFFEAVIHLDGALYRYGFEVTSTQVVNEWLFKQEKRKEEQLFLRSDCRKIDINGRLFGEGKDLIEKTRDNALFLTVAAQFNGQVSNRLLNWFLKDFYVLSALEDDDYRVETKRRALKDDRFRVVAGQLLNVADFGIDDISVSKSDSMASKISWPTDFPAPLLEHIKDETTIRVSTSHKKYNSKNESVGNELFDLFSDESDGTKRFFCLLGPVFRALLTGGVLVVDELDSSLHSRLVWRVTALFNNEKTNPKNAQLIFTTHDTTLLSQDLLRRDQMWFTEKDRFGVSDLYSLIEYELPVRNDASFERDYLKGKYGAVPNISSELDEVLASIHSVKQNKG